MSVSVSKRMARVKPSPTNAVVALAAELKAAGRNIINLGAGEPDFPTPAHIREAGISAIETGKTRYTPIDGTMELKLAIQKKFSRDNALHYEPAEILVSSGAKQTCFNACLASLGAGDEAIVPAPYWVSYPDMVRLADAEPVVIDTDIGSGFRISPQQLRSAITPRTRLLFLNSPSNPTGACYSRRQLAELGKILADHPRIVIASDEIYEHIYWADEPFASFAEACPQLYERTITINGVSKCYAMTGWRIGYAGGPRALIAAMHTLQSQSTSNPCSISQAAAAAAINGDQTCVADMTTAYRERHDHIVAALNEIPGFECRASEGAFYAFPRITGVLEQRRLANDAELVAFLLNEADVATVPGSAFGAPGYIRISFACSLDTLREAIHRIRKALS
ncbi:MAG: pyridoxal phosphate-dependent aminotransferase [Woeseia sp.]